MEPAVTRLSTPTLPPGRAAFSTTAMLFLGIRLGLLFVLPVEALFQYGDFQHYYNLAAWSVAGHCPVGPNACLPLLDYWYEFPPIFPYLSIALLHLVGRGGLPPFHTYAYALTLVLLLADFGSLWLVYRLGRRLHGDETANWLALVYALLPAPLILGWWTFDGLTTFWMLLALWALLERRDALAVGGIGLGVVTKLVPGLLLPVVWAARPPKRALVISVAAGAVALAVLLPFFITQPAVTVASLRAQVSKSSYATVWAMMDGNLRTAEGEPITGNFGPLLQHFDLAWATRLQHAPSQVPGWLGVMVFGAIYAAVWVRVRRQAGAAGPSDQQLVALFAFTWAIFVLWSKGWSPQWQQMLVPLILLVQPTRQGLLFALVLAAVSFLEWPILLSRGLAVGYWVTIPLRTLLMTVWALELGGGLIGKREKRVGSMGELGKASATNFTN
jgi:4-amino-4-deoxy-L-arabinose transferase-like glycosyltransferase